MVGVEVNGYTIEPGAHLEEANIGGDGGCPVAPRATGNVPTEDVVYLLHEMGFDTGLDLDLLIQSTAWLEYELQHSTPGLVAKAGGFPTP